MGLVSVSDPQVEGYYRAIRDETKEYQRKFRTVLRGITALAKRPVVLNPFRLGFFSFQVWSHKVMRWLVPWFALVLAASSMIVAVEHWIYLLVLGLQVAFYGLAAAGFLSARLRGVFAIRLPYFFVQANAAIAHALVAYVRGARATTWQPSAR
jgi:hypothetical protein